MQQLFAHGGIQSDLTEFVLEIAGATFTATGHSVQTAPRDATVTGTITATGLDALQQRLLASPLASIGGPALIFLKGAGRTVDDQVIWDIAYRDRQLKVNDQNLSAMLQSFSGGGKGPGAASLAFRTLGSGQTAPLVRSTLGHTNGQKLGPAAGGKPNDPHSTRNNGRCRRGPRPRPRSRNPNRWSRSRCRPRSRRGGSPMATTSSRCSKGRGYQTDLQYGEDDVPNQVSQIENMITKGAKVLVIAAIDGSTLTEVLAGAARSDIKVIAYDRLIRNTPNVNYYATFDNSKLASSKPTRCCRDWRSGQARRSTSNCSAARPTIITPSFSITARCRSCSR